MDPITATLVNILIGLVISGIGQLISHAFEPTSPPGPGTEVDVGGDVPLSFLVGTIGIAGKREYDNTWGDSGGTPNAYLTEVFSLGDLPGVAVTGFYENSYGLTKSTTGHTAQGYPVPERRNNSSDRLWWETFDGSQTTADSFLTSKFGSDPNYPFTSDMIGRGIPYIRMTALIDPQVWNGNPQYVFQCQGIPLYDPTQDSSVGGSGSQRLATPSTFAFSDNPAVIAYNILLGIYYGSTWVWGGRFLRDSSGAPIAAAVAHRLPYANWAAAINACNSLISLNAGGTEKQFRAGREISTREQPIDVINELLQACNARMTEQAGIYTIAVGDPGSAAATFTDADIVIGETQQLEPFPALDDVINGATATYSEPSQAWESKETVYYNSMFETADDGRRQLVGLQLTPVFSGTQAQRILQAQVKDARRFARHVLTLTPKWGTYRPLDVIAWTSTRNGYSSKAFLIAGMTILPNGNALVALQEVNPADHSWTPGTDEKPLTFAPTIPISPGAIPMTGWSASPYTYPDSSATGRRIGISVQFTGGLADVQFVQIQVIENFGSGNTVFDSGEVLYDRTVADPVTRIITWAGIVPNTSYLVRGRFISPPQSGRSNSWSSSIAVTTPNIGVGLIDIGSDVRSLETLFADRIAAAEQMLKDIQATSADLVAQNLTRLAYLEQSLSGVNDSLTASYKNEVQIWAGAGSMLARRSEVLEAVLGIDGASSSVITAAQASITANTNSITAQAAQISALQSTVNDPTTGVVATATALSSLTTTVTSQGGSITANSTAITALQTQLGNSGASARFVMNTSVSPSAGWDAAIGLQTSVTAGGTTYDAGIYLESKTAGGGSARVLLKGTQINFVDGSNNVYAMFDGTGASFNAARITSLTVSNIVVTNTINGSAVTTVKIAAQNATDLKTSGDFAGTYAQNGGGPGTGSPVASWNFTTTSGGYVATIGAYVDFTSSISATGVWTWDLYVNISGVGITKVGTWTTTVTAGTRAWAFVSANVPLPTGTHTALIVYTCPAVVANFTITHGFLTGNLALT